ncbi:MAG: glycosyl transferase [Methylobacterium sp. CG08_land_8_20_14_0_20_71_15]|uniref:Glycosyltransferase 2-like domain-containing protein n=2 Tax=Pseudomonadota TaxID=1224 RepID=A0ABQ4T0F9_9HYPH|nr:MAG: glycosyl transferase [Methylobacterium sp. CG09_land_8_20_14_0_10_71_15]PIU12433.1 MAG: glycosyl transferase [Methylobacterium sp. CG08_land_8_20_14_0_20_71_15]GBU19786.1 hypothetical protein AwMethylo_40010 [Methylobacterium sp.]GJE08817.1 hypothetical protein AOPFMNJM_4163 [Methylobacterium jeotgali]
MRGPVPRSDGARRIREGLEALRDRLLPARPWGGRTVDVRLEGSDDLDFPQHLLTGTPLADRWVRLRYRAEGTGRPVLRLERPGDTEEWPLPGVTEGRAFWLGLMPRDLAGIALSTSGIAGFALESVERRGHAGVILECALRRPLRAVAALYEAARGNRRAYRDILRGACAVVPARRYDAYARARSRPSEAPASDLPVHVIVPASDSSVALDRTVASLIGQSHRRWRLSLLGAGSPGQGPPDARLGVVPWHSSLAWGDLTREGEGLCLLRPGDVLAPDALAHLAAALPADPAIELVYADSVEAGDGRAVLKPGPDREMALLTGYHGRPALLAPGLASRLAGLPIGPLAEAAQALDIAAVAEARRLARVPRVLCRTAENPSGGPSRSAALARRLSAFGASVSVVDQAGVADLLWPLPEPAPLVSVVIPSRDRLDLIATACRGVLEETAYPAIELVIVDNGSTEPGVLAHYERLRRDPRVRIVPFPAAFNFSAMVNAGVAASSGAVVVLLNNDIAVLEPGWLEAMVRQALRPEVGAVGAKLLFGDGTLQHAGVVVGLGGRAGHTLRRRPAETPGRVGQLRVAHRVSAVTAACLAVTRAKYDAVGGFDAEAFPIDFNDVDFCLRLGARGYHTVWTPRAVLAHLESVSRGPSTGAKRERFEREADRFVARWRPVIRDDPFYHPALSLTTFGEDLE